eukprot:1160846-Pelagomonas_calceolata.AAC.2
MDSRLISVIIRTEAAGLTRKKERLRLPSPAACIKERSPVLKGRAPPHRPRERASTEVYSSKLAPTMGPTTRLSGRPCPASLRPTPKP